MKEILFPSNDDKRLVGKYARCMMMNLSIPIDEDLQKTLSLFEKVRVVLSLFRIRIMKNLPCAIKFWLKEYSFISLEGSVCVVGRGGESMHHITS